MLCPKILLRGVLKTTSMTPTFPKSLPPVLAGQPPPMPPTKWNSDQRTHQDQQATPMEKLCHYHKLFGTDALRCKGPCAWQLESTSPAP